MRQGTVSGSKLITLEDFERTLALGLEDSLANVRRELAWRVPDTME